MKRVLVLGDVLVDHFVYGEINRQSPEDPTTPVVDFTKEEYRLGGAANVAANIKSLSEDIHIEVCSVCSEFTIKMLSDLSLSILNNYKIYVDDMSKPSNEELVKTRIVNSKTNKQIVRLDNLKKFNLYHINAFYKDFCVFFDEFNYDAIVVSDYDKGLVSNKIIDILQRCICPIFIDTKKSDLSIWNKIKVPIIKLNNNEFNDCLKKNKESIKSYPYVIVTKSSDGCDLYNNGVLVRTFPTQSVLHPDVCGAGDTYLAALLVRCIEGYNIVQACEYATKAASISVKKQGTSTVSKEEMKDE